MTNFERIKAMRIEDFAKLLITYDERYGIMYCYGIDEGFDDSKYSYQEVVNAQVEYLKREAQE